MSRSWARWWVALGLGLWLGCGSDKSGEGGGGALEGDDAADGAPDASSKDASSKDAGTKDASRADAKASPEPNPVDPSAGTCAAITKDAPVQRGAVDVIWAVDNSPSMLDDILGVTMNMQSFFNSIEGSGAGVHIITVSLGDLASGTTLQSDADKYRFVPWNVFSKLVYESVLDTFDQYQDFLRPDAATQVVAVTDDDDLFAAADFVSAMEQKLGHSFSLHAIVADQLLCGSAVGSQYLAAADQTGGQKISLCGGDWAAVVGQLTTAVVAAVPLPCSYDMAEAATSAEKYDPTEVAVTYTAADSDQKQELPKSQSADRCADKPGWYYDDDANPTKLELCPAACELVKAGGRMAIAFGCEPTIYL